MDENQSNTFGCAMPLFLVLAAIMFVIGYANDRNLFNEATLSTALNTVEETIVEASITDIIADTSTIADTTAPRVVVVPNGNPPPVANQPFVANPPILQAPQVAPQQGVSISPTVTPYIPPPKSTIAVTVITTAQPVITVTATTQPIITVTATIEPTQIVITATPDQRLINQGGQAPAQGQGCTLASLGIGCGEPAQAPSATPIPPTPLPLDNHGIGGPVPIGPTPEVVKIVPHEEVVLPEPTLYVIVGTEMFGDLTVRSTFNGQQSGWTCYSSKYNGENVNCPLLQIEEWKNTHEVIIREVSQ